MDPGSIALFIPIVAIIMGTILLAIPVLGWAVRYAMKPLADTKGSEEKLEIMGQQLQLIEQQISNFEAELHRLSQGQEFHDKLLGGDERDASDLGRLPLPAAEQPHADDR
jgi:hypothetical protein